MQYAPEENITKFKEIDKLLQEQIDEEILSDLEYYLSIVSKKSKALASGLRRGFNNAKKSMRYVLAYELVKEDKKNKKVIDEKELKKHLENCLKDYSKKNDFMCYREFVRLLRACTIDSGGKVSSPIKEMYNEYFSGKRLIKAYLLGFQK